LPEILKKASNWFLHIKFHIMFRQTNLEGSRKAWW